MNTPEPCMNNLTKPPPGKHDLAFRSHSLQMILYGPIRARTQLYCGLTQNVTLHVSILNFYLLIVFFDNDYLLIINV